MPEPYYTIFDYTTAEERAALALRIRARSWPLPFLGCTVYEGKWTSGVKPYSQMSIKGKTWMVHRVLYECEVGRIERGMCLDHTCRFEPCIEPAHMLQCTIDYNTKIGNATLFKKPEEYDLTVGGRPLTNRTKEETDRLFSLEEIA